MLKGVGRNFSRGWLSGAAGEGSPAIFQFPGGGSTTIFGRFNGQNERIFGPGGGMAPSLPMPAYTLVYATALLLLHCIVAMLDLQETWFSLS